MCREQSREERLFNNFLQCRGQENYHLIDFISNLHLPWLQPDFSPHSPYILKSEQCWLRLPTYEDLHDRCIDRIISRKSDFQVYDAGEQPTASVGRALRQLHQPNASNPSYITNIQLPDHDMHFPEALRCLVTPHDDELHLGVNLTPKFTLVDLHVDQGLSGLSTAVGSCVKLWLLYPPKKHNLDVMRKTGNMKGRLQRIGKELKEGRWVITTAEDTIYLPAGWIHAVYTIEGGALAGITFMAGECIETVNHCIMYELAVNKIYNSNLFLSAIQVTLELHDERLITEAIKMWCCIRPQLKMDEKTQSRAREIWDKYFKSPGLHPRCPGCSWEGEDFVQHMRKTHMLHTSKRKR